MPCPRPLLPQRRSQVSREVSCALKQPSAACQQHSAAGQERRNLLCVHDQSDEDALCWTAVAAHISVEAGEADDLKCSVTAQHIPKLGPPATFRATDGQVVRLAD